MSIFSNISYYLKNDPQYKKNFLMYTTIVIILLIIGGVLLFLNTSLFKKDDIPQQTLIPGLENTLVTIEESPELQKVSQTEISDFSNALAFSKNNELVYSALDGSLVIDQQKIDTKDYIIIPTDIYFSDSYVIINSLNGVYKYKEDEGITKFDDNILSVVPNYVGSNLKEFFYLEKGDYSITLYSSTDIGLKINQEVVGEIDNSNTQELEIKVINNKPYIFAYQEGSYLGEKLVIVEFDENKNLQVKKIINNLNSVKISENTLLATVADEEVLGRLQTYLVDFSAEDGDTTILSTEDFLTQNEIDGFLTAQSCVINESAKTLTCAVKKDQKIQLDKDYRDILIEYNYNAKEGEKIIQIIYPGVIFMVNSLYLDNQSNLYLLYQRDNQIYKFVK